MQRPAPARTLAEHEKNVAINNFPEEIYVRKARN